MKVVNWIITLAGLWEFGDILALFVPGFGRVPTFMWNHIAVGLILMITGAWAARTSNAHTAKIMDWVAATAGAWLIAASFVLGNPFISIGLWNDVIVGVVIFILGGWAALASYRTAG